VEVLTRARDLRALGLEAPEVVLLAEELKKRGHDLPPVLEVGELVSTIQNLRTKE
jgi:hypothetical protein